MRLPFLLPIALLLPLAGQNRSIPEILQLPVAEAERIAYGPGPLQFGELRVPAGKGPHPVVIVVHGGCWVSKLGNLDERAVALDLVRPIAANLTAQGFATWNLEYRRVGNEGGGWPGTFQDIAAGADHLRRIAKKKRLDLGRTVAIGHSAGGHFALWLAGRAKLPASSPLSAKNPLQLRGVVDLDGPGDLESVLGLQERICGAPVIHQLLGGTPESQPQRYREASPAALLPLGVPQEVFAGQMFAGITPGYVDAAKRAGDSVHADVDAKAGHFVFVDPGSTTWPRVVAAIRVLAGR